jgi:hypothetical protein
LKNNGIPTRQGKSPVSDDAFFDNLPRSRRRNVKIPAAISRKIRTVCSKGDGSMKRFMIIAVVAGLAIAMTVLMANAQMSTTQTDSAKAADPAMGYGQGQMMNGGQGQMMDWSTMIERMDDHQQMMSRQFDTLQTRFGQMMKIDDLATLKKEMRSYMQMMDRMHQSMMAQDHMAGQMMSMMNNGNMPNGNMMGSGQ